MLDQTFSAKNLRRLCSISEAIESGLGGKAEDQLAALEEIANDINIEGFECAKLKCFKGNEKLVCKAANKIDQSAIKKDSSNLKKIFRVSHSDRQTLVSQIRALIEEKSPFKLGAVDVSLHRQP